MHCDHTRFDLGIGFYNRGYLAMGRGNLNLIIVFNPQRRQILWM